MMSKNPIKCLSFCPFCQYVSSNDQSYLNHIILVHYNMAYRCGQCLSEVTPIGQMLSQQLNACWGFSDKTAKIGDSHTAVQGSKGGTKKKKKDKKHCNTSSKEKSSKAGMKSTRCSECARVEKSTPSSEKTSSHMKSPSKSPTEQSMCSSKDKRWNDEDKAKHRCR